MTNANENTINVNMENLSTEERTQLLALIEKANKPQSNLWKPEDNEEYWFIFRNGDVNWERYNPRCDSDIEAIAIGNYFRTEEEAKFMVERLKVLQELRELADGYKFQYNKNNYILGYNHNSQMVEPSSYYYTMLDDIYFESLKAIENAIDTIGEERLKKYYFCIEE